MEVFGLFHSTPDYSSPPPVLKSLHSSFESAVAASFEKDPGKWRYVEVANRGWYQGPDGYGVIKRLTVHD